MSLEIQDPTNPTEAANSYKSLADYRARASILGVTLPDDDDAAIIKILTGQQYVDSKNYKGETVVPFQGTAFPRRGIYEYNNGVMSEYDNESIPQCIIDAVLYVSAEDNVYSTQENGKRVQRKAIDGAIDTTYFDDGVTALGFKKVTKADALLARFTTGGIAASGASFLYVV